MALRTGNPEIARSAVPRGLHRKPDRGRNREDPGRRGSRPNPRRPRPPTGGRQPRPRPQHARRPDRCRRRLDQSRPGGIGCGAVPSRASAAGHPRRGRLEPSRCRASRYREVRGDCDRSRRCVSAPDAQKGSRDRDDARAASLGQWAIASGRAVTRAARLAREGRPRRRHRRARSGGRARGGRSCRRARSASSRPHRHARTVGVLGGGPDAIRQSRRARRTAARRIRRYRVPRGFRRDPHEHRRCRGGAVGVRRPSLVLDRRRHPTRCARRGARCRGAHHDRERLGSSASPSSAAPAPLRPEYPARPADGRADLAAGLPARLPVKIAVRLPNWLGDTVMAVPALRSLREAFPEAHVLLAGPWVELLAGQGLGDVLVGYPRSWSGRLRIADTVRDFAGDTVVLFPNSFEAAAAAVYWGGRRRIGFALDGRGWLLTDALPLPAPRLHQVDEYLLLVAHLGATATAREPHLTAPGPPADTRQRARELMRESGAPEGKPRVGVHLGAAYAPAKVWARERVVEFCRRSPSRGAVPGLLGAPSDAPAAADVLRETRAVSLVGRDGPDLLPAVLTEIAVLVSGDTGVAHLAAALGTPVVALFGPTHPARTAPLGGVAGGRPPVPRAPCFYRACPIDHPCMRGILAETVGEEMDALLAGTS